MLVLGLRREGLPALARPFPDVAVIRVLWSAWFS